MAHPQSSFRGLFAKKRIDIGANQLTGDSTSLILNAGIKVSNAAGGALTANSTGLIAAKGVKISNNLMLTANSTGCVGSADAGSALPGAVSDNVFQIGSNSTGSWLAVRTTGTTWKYLNVTAVLPT